MRTNPTEAEAKMWNALRSRKLKGMKFKRPVPFENHIVDFLRADHKRVVEIDGPQHAENQYDQIRDATLKNHGFKILWFWNNEVLKELNKVCYAIIASVDFTE